MAVSARGGAVPRTVGIALREKAGNDHCDLTLYTQTGIENSADRIGGSQFENILWLELPRKKLLLLINDNLARSFIDEFQRRGSNAP